MRTIFVCIALMLALPMLSGCGPSSTTVEGGYNPATGDITAGVTYEIKQISERQPDGTYITREIHVPIRRPRFYTR